MITHSLTGTACLIFQNHPTAENTNHQIAKIAIKDTTSTLTPAALNWIRTVRIIHSAPILVLIAMRDIRFQETNASAQIHSAKNATKTTKNVRIVTPDTISTTKQNVY